MADNISIPGVTVPIAADVISGVAHQRLKLQIGADGTAHDLPGDEVNGAKVQVTLAPILVVDHVSVADVTVTRVPASAGATTIAAANGDRRRLSVFNDGSHAMILKDGPGVSAISWSVRIESQGYWEMPIPCSEHQITALWEDAAPTGYAMVTEG